VTKAANGRSSIYRGPDGSWHGWVSFGEDVDGRRRRKHVQAPTKREAADKVARLEKQRVSGYVRDRPVTIAEWSPSPDAAGKFLVSRLTAAWESVLGKLKFELKSLPTTWSHPALPPGPGATRRVPSCGV
jgi:hypothetical protein